MNVDLDRLGRTRQAMAETGLDGLLCRLPENIVMLTGYWPMNGFAFLVFSADGDAFLLVPQGEVDLAQEAWVRSVLPFPWGLVDSGDPFASVLRLLREVASETGLRGGHIGYEGGFEFIAPPYIGAEPCAVSARTLSIAREAFGESLVDATDMIHALRVRKTQGEIERLRRVSKVAQIGLATFKESVIPGVSEIHIAAAVESSILVEGTGLGGMERVRAWASVLSGARSAQAYKPFQLTSQRRLEPGDMAVLELAVVADGWWADVTRTRSAGPARAVDLERWRIVLEAREAAIATIRPGTPACAVDQAARTVIQGYRLGAAFPHQTGHGLGLRYHEPEPALNPSGTTRLSPGMVFSVEPGIYIEGWGGMRCEDNVIVTEYGADVLTEFPRELDA